MVPRKTSRKTLTPCCGDLDSVDAQPSGLKDLEEELETQKMSARYRFGS